MGEGALASPSVVPVCLIIILDTTVVFTYLALMPSWVAKYSEDAAALAWMASGGNISLMIGMVALGGVADRIGVKSTLKLSLFGMMLSLTAHALQWSYKSMFASRCILFFFAGTLTLCKTYVLVAIPEEKRAEAIRATSSCQVASISVGAAMGLLAASSGLSCEQISFILACVCACTLAISQTKLFHIVAEVSGSAGAVSRATCSEQLVISAMGYMTFAAQALLAAAMVAGPSEARARFDDTTLYQKGYLVFSVCGFLASMCSPRFVSFLGARLTCAACLLVFVVSEAVLDRWRSPIEFCAGFGVMGFAQGGCLPAVQFVLSSRVSKERMGTANGVNDAAGALGRVLAPLFIGTLYQNGLAWRISCMLPASALPLLLLLPREEGQGRDPLALGIGALAVPLHDSPKKSEYRTVSQLEESTL